MDETSMSPSREGRIDIVNEIMPELLQIDCRETAERIETDPGYRWMVQNKKFSSWLRESTSAVAYTAVLYASMLAASNVPGKGAKETVGEESKEVMDQGEGSDSIDVDKILRSASQPKKGGETIAGHALQKHAGRNPDIWGRVHGNSDSINNAAMKHIEEILGAPGSFQTVESNGRMFLEKMLPDGRGIRLNMDGTFKGFIDQIR